MHGQTPSNEDINKLLKNHKDFSENLQIQDIINEKIKPKIKKHQKKIYL